MGLYEELLNRKENSDNLNLDQLSPNELKKLFIDESKTDSMISNLFNVKPSKISYLRRKHGITIRNSIIDRYLNDQTNCAEELNDEMKKITLTDENITKISKALTHFSFRNGPIEELHADVEKNITDKDMEELNKFMVNRLAYVFTLIKNEQWAEFNFLVENMDLMFGHDWDDAVPDDDGNRRLFVKTIEQHRN